MQAPVFFVGECAYPHINLYDFKNLILYKLTKKKNVVAQENIVDENIIPVTVLFEAMKELSTNMPGEISPELADFLDKDFAISDVSALPSVEKQIDLWKFLDRSDEEKITNWINHVMKVVPLTWIGTGIHIYWQQGFYHFALGLIDLFPALNDLGPMANTIPCILWHLLGICVFDVEKNSSGLAQIYGTFFGFTMIYGASRMREFNLLSAFHKTPHYIKFIPPLITSLSNVFCSHTAKEMRQFWRNKLDPSVKPYLPEDINLIEEAIHAAGLKNK